MRWLGILLAAATLHAAPEPPRPLPPAAALVKARVNGKYGMLLRQIRVPGDHASYGAFHDWGWYGALAHYGDEKDVPAGHWVYVYPFWYVWRDGPGRDEGPLAGDRVAGRPDGKAWTAGKRPSWLLVEWIEPRAPIALLVRQTVHPGALRKVTAYRLDGTATVVWEGSDPLPPGSGEGTAVIPLKTRFPFARVRLDFASDALAGQPGIDAVGQLDEFGTTRWGCAGHASTDPDVPEIRVPPPAVPPPISVPPPPPADGCIRWDEESWRKTWKAALEGARARGGDAGAEGGVR